MKKLITVALILALRLPAASFAESADPDPICGRWSYYWDTRPMNEEYNGGDPMMSFIILGYDLFIFEDNSLQFIMSSIPKDGNFKLQWPAYEGWWTVKDDGTYTLKLTDGKHKAEFDDRGRLLVYIADGIPYPFYLVPSYDYMSETAEK